MLNALGGKCIYKLTLYNVPKPINYIDTLHVEYWHGYTSGKELTIKGWSAGRY